MNEEELGKLNNLNNRISELIKRRATINEMIEQCGNSSRYILSVGDYRLSYVDSGTMNVALVLEKQRVSKELNKLEEEFKKA
jgi:chaperonin cofactor prefoldin